MPGPAVSVVIPNYNSGAFLRPAVQSALAADPGIEVVIADDGSRDGSLGSVADLPARVVARPHAGVSAARNAGVRAASGRLIAFLDADDLLCVEGLAARRRYLETTPKAWAVGALPDRLIDEAGAELAPVRERMAAGLKFPFDLTLDRYRKGRFFPVVCGLFLYRRETLDRVGPFDETLPAAEDADHLFRLLAQAPVPILNAPAFERRLHGANMSMSGGAARRFRPEALAAIAEVNRRHRMPDGEISPWENDYL